MNPAIVIPTYWSTTDRLGTPGSTYCYDHATPIDAEKPQLDECLASLEQVIGLQHVILLVVAPPSIEQQAVKRVKQLADAHNTPGVVIVDSFKALTAMNIFRDILPQDIGEPIGLRGYGAIRNMGLLTCCALGCDLAVFIDDDEVVLDADFLANATYGIGQKPRSGVPVIAKSGYFLDRRNSALADRRRVESYNKYWAKRSEFNQWMTQALAGPRISRSNTLCGGCFAVHAEAFTRVAFDPWITRGEDLDYFFNLRFYGMDVWFDNKWRVRHNPPRIQDTAYRFLQDVYRWTYERRKIEVCNTNIDLHQITPDQLMPYPGPWIGPDLPRRIKKTSTLRTLRTNEKSSYLKIRRTGIKDAVAYAEENCTRYLEFQSYWNTIASQAWQNEQLVHIFMAEGMLNDAVAQRMAQRNSIYDDEAEQ
ncbi:MAG: glycosyltransferase [Coriobacteriales bacterium]|nr:glycosyltransferase [Coriobacteriales bacterium]